jgi:tyrosyl-tRNA synthetase
VPSFLEDLRWRGLIHQVTDSEALPARLDATAMVGYIGFDPTADSLHVGHMQQLFLLRLLQDSGHQPIALLGGGTGMIGDPSFKSDERNLLTQEQLDANRAGIAAQISRYLDIGGSGRAILADNAEWLGSTRLLEFLRDVGKHFSVNEMVRKDSVRARLEEREQSLSFTEFSYMLLQAWDYVQLYDKYNCELQLGGSDQWGNITEGIDLIRRLRGAHVFGITSPLITKADGTKFGKTEAGSVWLDPERTSPYAFSQFWFRTLDADVGSYLRRLTMLPRSRIEELDAATAGHPERRDAQRALAFEVTSMVHGETEARKAESAAAVLFTEEIAGLDAATLESALADAPRSSIAKEALGEGVDAVDALVSSGLASSRRDARQLLSQGSVYVNGLRADEDRKLGVGDALHGRWVVLRRGKANQHVLVVDG